MEQSNKRIAVLDVDSIAYAIGNPNKVLDETGQPIKVLSDKGNMVFQYVEKTEEELKQSADWIMNDILTKCQSTHYIGWMKGAQTTAFRLEVNPEYKANRKQEPPKWWNFVQNYLFSRWQCKYIHDIEVDDAVNITRLQLPDSFIVAIDGDLLGLEGTHYNWKTQQWVTASYHDAEYKFWSDMIVGQPGDNVKGLKGKGEAYVKRKFNGYNYLDTVFNEYLTVYGEYQGIKEFYKNYISLKILDQKEGFIVPEPIEFKKKQLSLITESI